MIEILIRQMAALSQAPGTNVGARRVVESETNGASYPNVYNIQSVKLNNLNQSYK